MTTIQAHSGERRHVVGELFSFHLSELTRVYAMIGNDPGGHDFRQPGWLTKQGWTKIEGATCGGQGLEWGVLPASGLVSRLPGRHGADGWVQT